MAPAFVAALPLAPSTAPQPPPLSRGRSRTRTPAAHRRRSRTLTPSARSTIVRTRRANPDVAPLRDDVELRQRLLSRAAYLGPVALHKVQSALELASLAGHARVADNLHVADIVAQLGMDCDTVCAAVLRGLVSVCGPRAVESAVGSAVLSVLRGYDSIEELVLRAEDARFNEASYANLRELALLEAGEEHRALSLRLAATLVAARGLSKESDGYQRELLARRAMFFDAPLANQLGMWYLQSEIEEAAFRHLAPCEYAETKRALADKLRTCGDLLATAKTDVETVLARSRGVKHAVSRSRVFGRVKGAYSVYRKMQRSGKSMDQIYDLLALRVIVAPRKGGDAEECAACYAVADAIRAHYPVLENRAKDYLVEPKSNGYRSLHLTILAGPEKTPLEVQIRTEKMHHVAEFGAAAHWIYKDGRRTDNGLQVQFVADRAGERYSAYVRPRVSITMANAAQTDESRRGYVAQLAEAIRKSRVIVNTCGQLYTLALGSTLSDLLSGLGLASLGAVAIVNGTVAPLNQQLQMNDIVRFICTVPEI